MFKDTRPIKREYVQSHVDVFTGLVFQGMKIQPIITGSYRRGAHVCGDIELVIPCDTMSEVAEVSGCIAKQFGCTESGSAKNMGVYGEVQFDLFPCRRHQLGSMLLHTTGSWLFNKKMRTHAHKMGFLLNQYGLFRSATKEIYMVHETEEKFFKYLEMEYVAPCDRSMK